MTKKKISIEVPNEPREVTEIRNKILNEFKDLQFEEGVLEVINETKNHFIVALETDIICGIKKEILQCGVQISERGTK